MNCEEVRGAAYYGDWFVDEFIEYFGLGFRMGNAVKYILRAGKKSQCKEKDLLKALTYIDREILRNHCMPRPLGLGYHHGMIDQAKEKFQLNDNYVVILETICGFNMMCNFYHVMDLLSTEIKKEQENATN